MSAADTSDRISVMENLVLYGRGLDIPRPNVGRPAGTARFVNSATGDSVVDR